MVLASLSTQPDHMHGLSLSVSNLDKNLSKLIHIVLSMVFFLIISWLYIHVSWDRSDLSTEVHVRFSAHRSRESLCNLHTYFTRFRHVSCWYHRLWSLLFFFLIMIQQLHHFNYPKIQRVKLPKIYINLLEELLIIYMWQPLES